MAKTEYQKKKDKQEYDQKRRIEKPRGRGRPPMREGSAKTVVVAFKVSEDEKQTIQKASKRAKMEKSAWIRKAILEAAQAV